jgi:hypothetical protein
MDFSWDIVAILYDINAATFPQRVEEFTKICLCRELTV